MLTSKEINPRNNIYYVGSKIIEKLNQDNIEFVDYFELYSNINKVHKISMQVFILSIDWLFLLKVVDLDDKGKLKKCF